MKSFVLNDETKINSYGFRVMNAGINLERFKQNPVMLDEHTNSTKNVLGRWKNIRIEGALLLADADFDRKDPESDIIAGKVERGFIKGASIGVVFDKSNMTSAKDGIYNLMQCELYEASICAIPSNANALSLYANTGERMSATAIKLAFSNIQHTKFSTMDLRTQILELLELPAGADDEDIITAISELKNTTTEQTKANAKALVDNAILQGKITMAQSDFYINSAMIDFAGAAAALGALKGRTSLAAQVNNPATAPFFAADDVLSNAKNEAKKKLDFYRKNDPKALEKDPSLYKRLLAAAGFGTKE